MKGYFRKEWYNWMCIDERLGEWDNEWRYNDKGVLQ